MRLLPFALLCAALWACEPRSTGLKSWPVDMESLAELHCRARILRESRFALADSMRTTESRYLLLTNPTQADSTAFAEAMAQFSRTRDQLVSNSKSLADSIATMLSAAITALDLEEKRALNDSLQRMITARGCNI